MAEITKTKPGTLTDYGDGFHHIRGSFKLGGVLDLGTHCALSELPDGRFVFLDMEVTTSARRFREVGAVRQQLRNLALWTAWNVGVSPSRLKRFYSDHDRG